MIYSAIRSQIGVPLRTAQDRVMGGPTLSVEAQVVAFFAGLGPMPKLWIDPSVAASRFQELAGTTPTTTPGQTIGKLLDVSGAANHVGQATTASCPLYQTSGALAFASFDGSNDSLYGLASFDLSTTDKVTVIAGVRKRSDVAYGTLLEHGVGGTNPLCFTVSAPRSAGVANYGAQMRDGTNEANSTPVGAAAPHSAVIALAMNYAGATAAADLAFRINGVQAPTAGANTTAAGFGNYILHVGRRNNASQPGAVDLFGLMIIGRLLTADELSLCERYMASKTGIAL